MKRTTKRNTKRIIAAVLCAVSGLAGVGCGSMRYEERRPDGGVISFKTGERQNAIAQLEKDYGKVNIESEYDPKATKPSGPFDPTAPVKPGERLATMSGIGSILPNSDEGKMHMKFSKASAGATPPGLPPAPKDTGVAQAGFQSTPTSSGPLPAPDMSGNCGTK
jgi:hypothetical protein